MSSVAAYGDGLNHAEDDPLASDIHPEPLRAQQGRRANGRCSACITNRDFRWSRCGRRSFTVRRIRFTARLFSGTACGSTGPIIIPGDGNRLMQFVYVNDLVEACFNALEKHTAPGRAFNVADEKPLTQVEVVNEFARAMGKQPTIVRVPRDIIARNGGNAFAPSPMYFGQYYDVPPITEAVGRVKRVLNVSLTPFATGLKETYKWYSKHGADRKADFAFEDELIRRAREHTRGAFPPA